MSPLDKAVFYARATLTFHRPQIEVIAKALAAQAGGSLDKVDAFPRLPLEADHHYLAPGLGYRSLLLLQEDTLRELASDGLSVAKQHALPGRYRQVAERADVRPRHAAQDDCAG